MNKEGYQLYLAQDNDEENVDYVDTSNNMPCDTYGPLACTESCPRYFLCNK